MRHIACVLLALLNFAAMQAGRMRAFAPADTIQHHTLDSVTVTGELPVMKVGSNGAMLYDAEQLAKCRPVANAFDLLSEIPGISKGNYSPLIDGTTKTTITINGRKSHMSIAEIVDHLEAMSPSQVKCIEIYYDAPPQYGVKGSVINFVMHKRRNENLSTNGSLWTSAYQGSNYYQTGGVNIALFQKRWMLDLGGSLGYTRASKQLNILSSHTIDAHTTSVFNMSKRHTRSHANKVTAHFDYDFSKESKLEVTYMHRMDYNSYKSLSPLWMDNEFFSENDSYFDFRKETHFAQIDYTYKTWHMGASYLTLNDSSTQDMTDETPSVKYLEAFATQNNSSFNLYANNSYKIGKGELRYGTDATWTRTHNKFANVWIEKTLSLDDNYIRNNIQKEHSADIYCGWTQTSKKLQLAAYMQLNYFNAKINKDGKKETLWEKSTLIPNINITYKVSPKSSLMLSTSADRIYPNYKNTSGRVSYYNMYYSIDNTTDVRGYSAYNAHLNYVYRNRYILGLYTTIEPKRFVQTIYQNPHKLEASYEFYNLKTCNSYGVMLTAPHNWTSWLNTKMTAYTFIRHTKATFHNISSDQRILSGKYALLSNILFSKKQGLTMQLNATYLTASLTGYAIDRPIFELTASMTWKPRNSGWNIVLKCTDLLATNNMTRVINFQGQNISFKTYNDTRRANLTVRYSFKGYKQKKLKEANTSRMGL